MSVLFPNKGIHNRCVRVIEAVDTTKLQKKEIEQGKAEVSCDARFNEA
jgi:hypothetical protein